MLLGPIFQVELVSTSRRGRYFALRVVYGLLLLLVLWTCYEETQDVVLFSSAPLSISQSSQLAAAFFFGFSWLQMLAVLALGPAMAVGTIATERQRRTIEYLFTTDLSNAEIVVGKAIARLLLLGKLLIVSLPILFLFRLLGGIPLEALLATFLLSASSALLVTALSIFVSVWSVRPRDATIRIYLMLGALIFLPLVLSPFRFMIGSRSMLWNLVVEPILDVVLVINPLSALTAALGNRFATGFGLDMTAVWSTVFWQTMVSVVALISATLAVRWVHLAESSRGSKKRVGRPFLRLPQWKPALGDRPMVWKEMFANTARTRLGFVGVIALGLILTTVFGLTIYVFVESISGSGFGGPNEFFHYLSAMGSFLGTGILLLSAARAATLVTTERENDSWMSLLSTPLSAREIVLGKMWGNLYSVRWALVVLLGMWAFGVLIDPNFLYAILLLSITFAIHLWYVTNLGLNFSLRSKTTLQAMGGTLATLIFFGGGYLFCCCAVMFTRSGPEEILLAACIPFLLAMPTMAYIDLFRDINYRVIEDGMAAAYIFGVLMYLAIAAFLSFLSLARFDDLAGRATGVEGTPPIRTLAQKQK